MTLLDLLSIVILIFFFILAASFCFFFKPLLKNNFFSLLFLYDMNEAFAARKKVGKTWGKVKRASGIQKSKSNPLEDDSQHEDTSFDNSRNAYRAELVSFYTEFNPEKLPEVDQILDAYEGRESDLMEKLFAIRDQQRQQPRPAPPPPPPPPSHPDVEFNFNAVEDNPFGVSFSDHTQTTSNSDNSDNPFDSDGFAPVDFVEAVNESNPFADAISNSNSNSNTNNNARVAAALDGVFDVSDDFSMDFSSVAPLAVVQQPPAAQPSYITSSAISDVFVSGGVESKPTQIAAKAKDDFQNLAFAAFEEAKTKAPSPAPAPAPVPAPVSTSEGFFGDDDDDNDDDDSSDEHIGDFPPPISVSLTSPSSSSSSSSSLSSPNSKSKFKIPKTLA